MKVGLYVRKSKDEQTLEQQVEKLKEFCEREKYEIFRIYKEEGVSGAKTSRPQLDLMLQDMRENKFNAVIVWKFDRLGRSTTHLLQVLDELKNKGVRLIATSQNIDTSTSMGKFFFTILGGFAEMERELIIERTKNKLFKSFKKLRVYTKEPGKEADKKRPMILEPGETVKDCAEKILKGFSQRVKQIRIWGPSSKFPGQIVGMKHKIKDLDIVEFKTK